MKKIKIGEIIEFLNDKQIKYVVEGNVDQYIRGFATLKDYKEGCITWIRDASVEFNKRNQIALCIAPYGTKMENAQSMIFSDNPKMCFFEILTKFFTESECSRISVSSIVETNYIGKNVSIGHHCYICPEVFIGDNVKIDHNVVIKCPAKIGNDCVISSGVVIGTDGFGYYRDNSNKYRKVPHFGGVEIGNSVEIGANTCIDRGTIEDTIIEDNVKIDNLCHIAHNVHIGENSMIIAQTMLGGSCELGKDAYIAPAGVVMNQAKIGDGGFVGMGAVVVKDVENNKVVAGVPAKVIRNRRKEE